MPHRLAHVNVGSGTKPGAAGTISHASAILGLEAVKVPSRREKGDCLEQQHAKDQTYLAQTVLLLPKI